LKETLAIGNRTAEPVPGPRHAKHHQRNDPKINQAQCGTHCY
jgi:hypothetical protein